MKEKESRFIPYLFFIFFGIIITVDSVYIYIATKTWRGIYTENAYQKGLNYNQTLADQEKQKKLGWSMKATLQNIHGSSYLLTVKLFDKNHHPIKNAKINIKIIRPIQEGFDFSQDLLPLDDSYQTKINFPLQGQWEIEYDATKDDNSFKQTSRYVI
jgi:nitrogen fixation protein FixH